MREDEEEDVSSYQVSVLKREGTVILKTRHWIKLFGELVTEEVMQFYITDFVMTGCRVKIYERVDVQEFEG